MQKSKDIGLEKINNSTKIMISETNMPSSQALKNFSKKLIQLKAHLQKEHEEVG